MLATGSNQIDAERAFTREARARRRAALARRLAARAGGVRAARGVRRAWRPPHAERSGARVREIPLDAIRGTLEPSRAAMFDEAFRPSRAAKSRWQRVWLAETRGAVLPPISVIRWATSTPCATGTTGSRSRGRAAR